MKKLIILFLLMPLWVAAQRDYTIMAVNHTELAPNVHRLFVGNVVTMVAFAGPDGLMLIDAAYEQTTKQVKDTLQRIVGQPVRYLVNTHLHADHTGGNTELGKGADIIAHHSVKTWLVSDRKQGERIPGPMPVHAIPNITFEGTLNMDFNGQQVQLRHLPNSHTAGDIIIYLSHSNVLVLGDLLFADNFPFVDVNQGGNPLNFIKSLHWVTENFPDNVVIVGGHGPVYNMAQLKTYLANLVQTIAVITEAKTAGFTAEQMKQQRILAQWESFGKFFITEDRWIDTLYPYVGL
ncbi:MAG: MBL fold metallo-hydrolase [Bacteroidales bacterium]|nr:MBL fold metallo-hydrolase [Bacteroidales bacterium]MDZ4204974.1 MBL fold metallo-hydrolase [Bacteroidales bacterium]